MKNKLLAFGMASTLISALCCFTPILPIVFAAIGLSGLLGLIYTDVVLLPMLGASMAITVYALWRQKKSK